MKRKRMTILSAALVSAMAISGAAVAQGGPGWMSGERGWGMWDGGMMGWGMRDGRGPWGRGPDGMLDRIEGRLAFIKAELKITEQQSAAWNELAGAIRAAARQHNDRMKAAFSGEARAKTLLERLDSQEQFMAARVEEIKQIKGSLKALYALLSDEQKKEADHIVLPMVGMGGPWS
jgi:hypothetical protein